MATETSGESRPTAAFVSDDTFQYSDDNQGGVLLRGARASAIEAEVPCTLVEDPVAFYRRQLIAWHSQLVPFFGESGKKLDDVYVELFLERASSDIQSLQAVPESQSPASMSVTTQVLTLRQLLSIPPDEQRYDEEGHPRRRQITGRWVVLGMPGSGKSTIARRLGRVLASEDERAPLPILINLAQYANKKASSDPFEITEEAVRAVSTVSARGLAQRLMHQAADPGRVWLIFDGLDEVEEEDRHETLLRRSTLYCLAIQHVCSWLLLG